MRIATWNINSLRARTDRVVAFLQRHDVDVLALQELKARPEQLDLTAIHAAGYETAVHGLNQWNGVGLISRVGLQDVRVAMEAVPTWPEEEGGVLEARMLSGVVGDGLRVWSLYVPNGREIDHPHYAYKLRWLEAVRAEGARELAADPEARTIFAGDFNVAPQDDDVWDMGFFEGRTHVTAPEREAFGAIVDAGYADLARPYTPGPGVYTFWDYQALRFPKKEGMRIDFLLGSPAVQRAVTDARIDRDERKGKGASDHAPVIVDLEL
ncbi:exodeoxyribonuclease III [Brachybacterium huguangmaarense]|uniref:Exodeoxyribonuclease III n=1 Tax=Brachybacterium huguangmaarense TaxID=1652028 RepID=A0ABY6G5A0_9MICO|nr:exodeoxyribonuclease III [Brachybacterium huguangmaarense]UYG17981.1 exodeoxyribonuclease III [Brachybacterium huguangmaarense]